MAPPSGLDVLQAGYLCARHRTTQVSVRCHNLWTAGTFLHPTTPGCPIRMAAQDIRSVMRCHADWRSPHAPLPASGPQLGVDFWLAVRRGLCLGDRSPGVAVSLAPVPVCLGRGSVVGLPAGEQPAAGARDPSPPPRPLSRYLARHQPGPRPLARVILDHRRGDVLRAPLSMLVR